MASKSDPLLPALPSTDRMEQSSGVHTRARTGRASEWRDAIAEADGSVTPMVDSLLSAYEALELRSRFFAEQVLAARAVLDRLTLSVHVVSRTGVVFANSAGRRLERDGVLIDSDGRLECAAYEAKEQFAEAYAAAERALDGCHPFVLVRDSGPRLLGLAVSAGRSLPGAVIVVVRDPEAEESVDAEVFAQHFGLTPAEARVAVCLAAGETARQAADSLGIGVETVRTHVKSILRKMGTNRQVDAVRMLVTGPLLVS
ncbi:MAG: helix-turn-helix transcriptional regulator [Deltaproteobacteria bacterium]|nr:helix-turn-helix transcriptional regulator [Deltaproteobacteria bacterium]